MSNKLPKILKQYAEKLNLNSTDFWEVHGTPVIKHKALEKIADYAGISFDDPTILESDPKERICVMIVKGRLKDSLHSSWSVGEAMPMNLDKGSNKQSYPYAMAEKRAKDRVILKLIGVAGDVYSESEAEDFRQPTNRGQPLNIPEPPPSPPPPTQEYEPGVQEPVGEQPDTTKIDEHQKWMVAHWNYEIWGSGPEYYSFLAENKEKITFCINNCRAGKDFARFLTTTKTRFEEITHNAN